MKIAEELRQHFERRVVIGLHRIRDFYESIGCWSNSWGIDDSAVFTFKAIDARKCNPPPTWGNEIPALWACGESHRQVIARALSDDVQTLLIMEDDARFTPEAATILLAAMAELPPDWDGLMLGGQVSVHDGRTIPVSPRISKCIQVERLHCYALSRSGMQNFHDILCEPTSVANDYRWGDAQADGRLTVYRIEPFIAYQADGESSISGRVEPARAWDDRVDVRLRDPEEIPVISLVCPFPVLEELRRKGIVSNGGESPPQIAKLPDNRAERGEREIAELMLKTCETNPAAAIVAIETLRRDAAYHRHGPLVLWHPTTAIPYDDARTVQANTFEEAAGAIQTLNLIYGEPQTV